MQIHRDRNDPEIFFRALVRPIMGYKAPVEISCCCTSITTYVDPRKNARDRLKPNKKTDTIAVRSIATEVEYTCMCMQRHMVRQSNTECKTEECCEWLISRIF